MRIAILAGAVALATPVVADAAIVRFSYESGTPEFVRDREGFYPSDRTSPITSQFVIDVQSIENINYDLTFFNGDISESGGSVISGYVDEAASVFGFSVLQGSARFSTDSDGNVISASAAGFGDSPDVVIRGSEAELSQGTGGVYYRAVGEWKVTALDTPEVAPVPLPATAPLIAMGLAAMGWASRRRS